MKLLHFVDAAGTDEHYVPAKNVNLVEIRNAANLSIWFSNSDGNTNDHRIDITGILPADSADECADYFATLCAPDSKGGIYSFKEGDVLPVSATNAAGAAIASPVLTTIADLNLFPPEKRPYFIGFIR